QVRQAACCCTFQPVGAALLCKGDPPTIPSFTFSIFNYLTTAVAEMQAKYFAMHNPGSRDRK
ncbi:MAG: hypothetical protein SOH79_05035, partial [Heyndrickxia faecalis]